MPLTCSPLSKGSVGFTPAVTLINALIYFSYIGLSYGFIVVIWLF